MKKNTNAIIYKEFTDLNKTENLADFIEYLRDRNVVHFAPHINKFGNDLQKVITEMYHDWKEVAKTEVKEMNEHHGYADICSICGSPIEEERARQDEDENIICEDCFLEKQAQNKHLV